MTTAMVIGGGIAGSATALALQRAGIEPAVFEAHEQTSDEVGSYLNVATNGIDALRAIGADGVLAAGFPTRRTQLYSGTGKLLATLPIGSVLPDGTVSQTIKRARLTRALNDEVARRGISIMFGKRLVTATRVAGGGVAARFGDGTEASADLLVGADGLHSVTRRLIDPGAPTGRYVGLVNFGGYTANAAGAAAPETFQMIFGGRAFFGYTLDPSGGVVWFANVPRPKVDEAERASTSLGQWQAQLADLFRDDRGPAAELIAAGHLEGAADNTHDLPPVPAWHRESMIIIGDAAHAPAPTSGQGASIAIEDGVVLAKSLRDLPSIAEAFARYERLRRARVERIVELGARQSTNKMPGSIGRLIRDLTLPLAFRFLITEKSQAWMYDHHIDWASSAALDSTG